MPDRSMTLTQRVTVYGVLDDIDWPAGTRVSVRGEWFTRVNGTKVRNHRFSVTGPGGVRVTLPARLLEAA